MYVSLILSKNKSCIDLLKSYFPHIFIIWSHLFFFLMTPNKNGYECSFHSMEKNPHCWQDLEYADCIPCGGVWPSLQKKGVLSIILNFLWWWNSSFKDCGVHIHCHYSQSTPILCGSTIRVLSMVQIDPCKNPFVFYQTMCQKVSQETTTQKI